MGLFKQKTDYKEKMKKYLTDFMDEYLQNNPKSNDVNDIFSKAMTFLRIHTEKALKKMMEQNHVNAELGMLNILQNMAMTEIKPQDPIDFLKSTRDQPAYTLYNYINDVKLEKGYISQAQYEENQQVATKLSLKSMF